jgi:deoxyribodipyrimidine photo-lyase
VLHAPSAVELPAGAKVGRLPSLEALGFPGPAPALVDRPPASEAEAQRAATRWVRGRIATYDRDRNTLADDSSRLSVHLRFGTLSPRWLEERVIAAGSRGATTFRSELAWRDFYAAVLLHFPDAARREFQERYRALSWEQDDAGLQAWKDGMTGYPVVDAAMRQLRAMGWMHNRARMIVASFLTKDLHLDWREGEAHFMHHLLDGDVASNNGGWQWVASTGTDPAPYFQRLFNPTLQQGKFDADGRYVRRWVPELAGVPDAKLAEPWTMSEDEQGRAGCVIGRDYPAPIVDHAAERRRAIERYRAVAS